jgi:hypothetical protein
MSDLDLLRGLGDQIVPPSFDALRETARRRARRTTTAAVVAAAAALALVAGTTVLLATDDDSRPEPTKEPTPAVDTTHPLTYAEGTTIRYGDRSVTAPAAVVEIDVTDDGVVARTDDGGIWFTDGTDVEQLGTLGDPGPAYDDENHPHPYAATWGFVVSDNLGSRVAWFEFPRRGEPELVVYDTRTREETARQPLDVAPGSYALLGLVTERYGYWFTDPETDSDNGPLPQARIDLATGAQEQVTRRVFDADHAGVGTPRTMMISHAEGNQPARYVVVDGTAWQFNVTGGRVEPQGAQPLDARDGGTRKKFSFDAPDGYPDTLPMWLSQWLDDDTVVITGVHGADTDGTGSGDEDLLECHLSTRACAVALTVPPQAVMPEVG